jgi:hypothetical protein
LSAHMMCYAITAYLFFTIALACVTEQIANNFLLNKLLIVKKHEQLP